MPFSVTFATSFLEKLQSSSEAQDDAPFRQFLQTIDDPQYGFFRLPSRSDLLEQCEQALKSLPPKNQLVHVGIGGSALGAEMLLNSLGRGHSSKSVAFIDNIDSDKLSDIFDRLDWQNALFSIVSKSGSTAETMAAFSIICGQLQSKKLLRQDLKNLNEFFLFVTDPNESQLLTIGKEHNVTCLEIPPNVGGRFSALTPVGLFPAFFVGIDSRRLLNGAREVCSQIVQNEHLGQSLIKAAKGLTSLYRENQIDQTVLMPYSSKWRTISNWFVQLWAESLGKVRKSSSGEVFYEGMTPISAYGATDQHSQVQLFMEGPANKCILFVSFDELENDFPLNNQFAEKSLQRLAPYSLNQLMQAEMLGTQRALEEKNRDFIHIKLTSPGPESMGALIMWLESLTVLVGHHLGVNPFNQPGVEAGKKYAFEFLESN